MAAILTVCGVFAVAIVLIETRPAARGGRVEAGAARAAGPSGGRSPARSCATRCWWRRRSACLVPSAGLTVPEAVATFLKLLGGAAAPCALVALGLFLAQTRHTGGGQGRTAALLVGLKLALHPLLAYGLGHYLFDLPPLLLHTAVLMAALPTGTGPFMLAEFYRREADLTATVVLASTVLAVVTVSAYLAVIA
ncbi:AEC family transporter [Methylobacterium oryzae CBMB20]